MAFIVVLIAALFSVASPALAAGVEIPHFIDFYHLLLANAGLSEHEIKVLTPILGSLLTLLITVCIGLSFKSSVSKMTDYTPQSRFSLRTMVEMIMDFLYGLTKENLHDHYKQHLTLMSGIFFFILISNLCGLVPGFPPPTGDISTNLSMGLIVFLVYNYAGFSEHGVGYLKHFLGPVVWIAPLILVVEMISHLVRPISLSMRLLINVFADHLILSVMTGITWIFIPAVMLFFGLLVSVVQAYVFALLTATYISMATSHDH